MSKVKCYSVRLESLISISEKAYKATAFDGTTAIIPKSQVFGQDYDVQKSDAYWISSWILGQKELQYSSKKESWFEKELSHASSEGVEIERHVPEEKEAVEVEPIAELVKEESAGSRQFVITSPCYRGNGYHGGYVSYAETDKDGNFTFIEGDHYFGSSDGIVSINGVKNIFDTIGLNYSDDDRPIRIKEVFNFNAESIKERSIKKVSLREREQTWQENQPKIRWAKTKKDKATEDADVALAVEYKNNNPFPKADFIEYYEMCKILVSL